MFEVTARDSRLCRGIELRRPFQFLRESFFLEREGSGRRFAVGRVGTEQSAINRRAKCPACHAVHRLEEVAHELAMVARVDWTSLLDAGQLKDEHARFAIGEGESRAGHGES